MSGISGVGRAGYVQREAGPVASAGGGFSVPAASGGGVSGVASASDVGLAGLLALQAEGAETVEDRAARKRGREMLDELERLHRALLGEVADFAGLRRLAELAEGIPVATDAGLRAVMGEITLRARVELARYEVG